MFTKNRAGNTRGGGTTGAGERHAPPFPTVLSKKKEKKGIQRKKKEFQSRNYKKDCHQDQTVPVL